MKKNYNESFKIKFYRFFAAPATLSVLFWNMFIYFLLGICFLCAFLYNNKKKSFWTFIII